MVAVEVVETPSLGNRSYLVTDGEVAAVVDPQRDVDRLFGVAGRSGVRFTHVLETHLHNDYVSGGLELCRLTGAEYGVSAAEAVDFPRRRLVEGDVVELSPALRLRVVDTPGHTFHHLSYVLEEDGRAIGAFTGGSLLFGASGRTDLLGPQHGEQLARRQHASLHKLAEILPDDAEIWPTHGFGGFCASTPVGGRSATVGQQKKVHPAFQLDEDAFVEHLLSGLDPFPAYFARMPGRNAAGPEPVDLRPPESVGPEELARRLRDGEWVVDVRPRREFTRGHLAGSVNFGVDGPLATWLGWLAGRDVPVTLVGEVPEQVADGRRELARIGIDRLSAAVGRPHELALEPDMVHRMPTATFADLVLLDPEPTVLDVRLRREWRQCHLRGAVHVPLPELATAELAGGPVWVHCSAGYRATVAASLLARDGRDVVVVDDDFDSAHDVGLTVASDV